MKVLPTIVGFFERTQCDAQIVFLFFVNVLDDAFRDERFVPLMQ